jgi:hypothetical protein
MGTWDPFEVGRFRCPEGVGVCPAQGSAAWCSFYLPYLSTYRLIGESMTTPNDPAW